MSRFAKLASLCAWLALGCSSDTGEGPEPGEGFLAGPAGRIWYQVAGTGTGTPIVLLHGGPGAGSLYLRPMLALGDERPVIIYDQLGAGRSEGGDDTTRFTIAHHMEELDSVRSALGLREIHLFGHSWGSMLATDYVLSKPSGVRSVIFASSVMSASRWQHDADSLLLFLPDSIRNVLSTHESAGTTDSPEYQQAMMSFYTRFVFRKPVPPAFMDSIFAGFNQTIYQYMWGPSEFRATGTLKTYERVDRLEELTLPILFTAGEFDEGTPDAHRYYQSRTPGSKLEIIPGAAHMTMMDATDLYLSVIREFLAEVERDG